MGNKLSDDINDDFKDRSRNAFKILSNIKNENVNDVYNNIKKQSGSGFIVKEKKRKIDTENYTGYYIIFSSGKYDNIKINIYIYLYKNDKNNTYILFNNTQTIMNIKMIHKNIFDTTNIQKYKDTVSSISISNDDNNNMSHHIKKIQKKIIEDFNFELKSLITDNVKISYYDTIKNIINYKKKYNEIIYKHL